MTAVENPPMTRAQVRALGLERANEVRSTRAKVARGVRGGRVDVCELIRRPPKHLEKMRVESVLRWVRFVGPERVKLVVGEGDRGLLAVRTLGSLTTFERVYLIERIGVQLNGNQKVKRADYAQRAGRRGR